MKVSLDHTDLSQIAKLIEGGKTGVSRAGAWLMAGVVGIGIVASTVVVVGYLRGEVDREIEQHGKTGHNGSSKAITEVQADMKQVSQDVAIIETKVGTIDANQSRLIEKVDSLREDMATLPSVQRMRRSK